MMDALAEQPLVLLGLGLMLSYGVSLWRNPWRACHWCGGHPKRRGWAFWWSRGLCRHCNGTGRKTRFGRKVYDYIAR